MVRGKKENSQDVYLNDLRKRRQSVVIYLTSGIKQTGVIDSFDQHALLLRHGNSIQLIYKHTIASIMPATKALPMMTPGSPAPAPARREPTTVPVVTRRTSRKPFMHDK